MISNTVGEFIQRHDASHEEMLMAALLDPSFPAVLDESSFRMARTFCDAGRDFDSAINNTLMKQCQLPETGWWHGAPPCCICGEHGCAQILGLAQSDSPVWPLYWIPYWRMLAPHFGPGFE